MKNELYLNAVTQTGLDDFNTEVSVELFGKETEEQDYIEAASTWNGHHVGYTEFKVTRIIFTAEGFKFHHPAGAVISGLFNKPVTALEVINDAYGDEIESDDFAKELRAAIVAKCGSISGMADLI
jgi:hypothetical protein